MRFRLVIMMMTALLCTGCSAELSVALPEEQPSDSLRTDLIFPKGLRHCMMVGQKDTVTLSWEHGLLQDGESPSVRFRVIRGGEYVTVDSLGGRYSVGALSDGDALLRAGIGDYYRDFRLKVESSSPESPGKDYRSSSRVRILGIPGSSLMAYEPYALSLALDDELIPPERGHVYLDEGDEDISKRSLVTIATGEHILLCEVELPKDNIILYRRFAVKALQRDKLMLLAGLLDDSANTLGNAAVFLAYDIPGNGANISLSIKLNAGSKSKVLFCEKLSLQSSGYLPLVTYGDVSRFVMEHINSTFSIDIIVTPLDEYHLLSVDFSMLLSLARELTKKDITVRINGVKCKDGKYEQSL